MASREASRLIDFGRGAALADGGFGWLGADGKVDVTQPCPLYVNARMTYVFALAHLAGVAGADALAASGLGAFASRYADRANGGWFSSVTVSGKVIDSVKANYAHAHVLLAASSAVAAGIPGAEAALAAAAAAIEQHFWSDAEGCALESWNADFTELEPYRGANSNMHSVEAYLAAGDVTGNPVWHARAASIAARLIKITPGPIPGGYPSTTTRAGGPSSTTTSIALTTVPALRHHAGPFLRMGPAAAGPGGRPGPPPAWLLGSGNRALRYGRRRREGSGTATRG